MGAKFDISLFTKSIIDIGYILKIIDEHKLSWKVTRVDIIDDWEYSNCTTYNEAIEEKVIRENINKNKIIVTDIILNSNYRCGYSAYKISDNLVETNLWVDTSYFNNLDVDEINTENQNLYDNITNIIVNNIEKTEVKLIGLGVETTIVYSNNIRGVISKSYGVNRWIVPYDRFSLNELRCFKNGDFQIIDKIK